MKLLLSLMFAVLLVVDVDLTSAQIPQPVHFLVTVSDTQLANSRRDKLLTNLSARAKRLRKGNGVAQSYLELMLKRNTTYYAIPDGEGWMYLVPNDGFAQVYNVAEIDLAGEPNTQIPVSFVLPQRLYPDGDTSRAFVATEFNGTSAAWGALGAEINYFDPRIPTSISLDTSGKASIVLGGIFEVGATLPFDGYEGKASLTVSGDTATRDIYFYVSVDFFQTGAVKSDLELADLVPGRSYNAAPDSAGSLTLTPNDGIAAFSARGEVAFGSEPHSRFLVSLILPKRLYPTGGTGSGYVSVRYDSTSAAWRGAGGEAHHFDPGYPVTMSADSSGYGTIELGGIFQADSASTRDAYEGEALVTAQYLDAVEPYQDADYPKSFELSQNYPNPFNPTTTFRFQIPSSSNVKLRIFDLMGREVAILVNDVRMPGRYSATWDASSISSGIYFYKLEAGLYSDVKKLVLIR